MPDRDGLPFKVMVDDNYHYMDESERYTHGSFASVDEALVACKKIVDECLQSAHKPGMSADELYKSYTMFGDDPFILPSSGAGHAYSSWAYAKEKCKEMCKK